MPNATGTITKIFPNNGKPRIILDTGLSASAFSQAQLCNAQEGQQVSFAYETKTVNGKEYTNIKGNLAIISSPQGASNAVDPAKTYPIPSPQSVPVERNGMQVGAAINQAIAYHAGEGVPVEAIEDTAKSFLLMGDRLSRYEVAYKAGL
jgi:cold shock CspA family protein